MRGIAFCRADKNYEAFVEGLKAKGVVPHIAIQGRVSKTGNARKTSVPPEVAASEDYAFSQRKRKRIEEIFGWKKTIGGLDQLMVRGLAKSDRKESEVESSRLDRMRGLVSSAPEIKTILRRFLFPPPLLHAFVFSWSLWRRIHQARAA